MKFNSNLYALIGAIFYGVGNPVIEKKLSTITPISFIFCESLVMFTCILLCQGFFSLASPSSGISIPNNISTWMWIILCTIFVFLGGMFYIKAFSSGGDAITISLMLLMSPVAAAVVSTIWTKKLPTAWHIAGYILAALAVFCIMKSNSPK